MTSRRSLLLLPLSLPLMALVAQPMPQKWQGGHPESLDPAWDLLTQSKTGIYRKSGVYTATFPPFLRDLAGKPFKIEGFILPLEPGRDATHFALTRRNSGCPFCPPNEPTEAVEVRLRRPVRISPDLLMVTGRLVLHGSSNQGLFYELADASVG